MNTYETFEVSAFGTGQYIIPRDLDVLTGISWKGKQPEFKVYIGADISPDMFARLLKDEFCIGAMPVSGISIEVSDLVNLPILQVHGKRLPDIDHPNRSMGWSNSGLAWIKHCPKWKLRGECLCLDLPTTSNPDQYFRILLPQGLGGFAYYPS